MIHEIQGIKFDRPSDIIIRKIAPLKILHLAYHDIAET